MNNLKNLTIRTKKSISGLLSGYGDEGPASPKAAENTTPMSPATPLENDAAGLEEFGAVGRDSFSSNKDNPSKRHRLLGSLRTIGSMRSLRSGNVKSDDDTPPISPARVHPEITPIKRERPSLALTFEEAPFHCFSGTEIEDIRHRAAALPIAEPVRDSVIDPTGLSAFTVGSVMDSPAPIQKMLDRENDFNVISRPLVPTRIYDGAVQTPLVFSPMAECPPPTPMPGTNFPMDGDAGVLASEIYVSSPSMSAKEQDELPNYFDLIPMVVVQPHTDQEHVDCTNSHVATKESTVPDHESVFMLAPMESNLPQPHTPRITVARKLKPCDLKETMIPSMDSDPFALDDESRNSLDAKKNMVRAFIARENQPPISDDDTCSLGRRLSAWGRHNGLYDGTGYGDDEAAFHESVLHGITISRTIGDGVVIKETPIFTLLPQSLISEEDTINLAQQTIFENSAEGKSKAKVEDPLLLGPGKKWPNYTADERKEISARPYRKYTDDKVKEMLARGVNEPLWPMPGLPDSPIDKAAALEEPIRTSDSHWYETDTLEAQAIRFMGRFPEDEVMARGEIAEEKRKSEETKFTKMITEMNKNLGDMMPKESRGGSKKKASRDMTNKTHGDARKTRRELCYGRICEQYTEACDEMTEEDRMAEEAAVAKMIWLINENRDVNNRTLENKTLKNIKEPQGRHFTGHLSEQDIEACGEPTDEMKSEVAESFKQMNESLGG